MVPDLSRHSSELGIVMHKKNFQNKVTNAIVAWRHQKRFLDEGTLQLNEVGNTFFAGKGLLLFVFINYITA